MSFEAYGRPKPVKEGEELDVQIDDISKHGDGVAHVNHFVVFVKEAGKIGLFTGQRTKIRITGVRARFAVSEVLPAFG